jgi:protease IV
MQNNSKIIILAAAIGCLPWQILCGVALLAIIIGVASISESGQKVAIIHVSGVITGGSSGGGGLFDDSHAGAEGLIKSLERARNDNDVKAIVLRINSPGGSAAGSQEVYDEIMKVRRDGKVVVTSMGDLAASGGYYIACASDKIYANGSTLTGSIGVIMETSDMSQLFKKLGIEFDVIKSGKHKDMGSPYRKMSPEEKQLAQDMINDVFGQFVSAVSEGRKIPKARVRKIADGRVFTGVQARKLGLVDVLGGFEEAKAAAARLAGIKGEPKYVDYDHGLFGSIFGGMDSQVRADYRSPEDLRRILRAAPDIFRYRGDRGRRIEALEDGE